MPVDSLPALLEDLERRHLLEPEQLEVIRASAGPKLSEPRALLVELVKRGWLTPFQVNQVSQGKIGDLVLGQYLLLERIGEGGMGQVFKARHRLMKRLVALKIIRPDHVADPATLRRFRQEIQAAARLSHPNIVLAHDADEVDGKHFLTMEYVEGTDLGKLVKQQGPLPVATACDYVRQAACGLQHAHEQGMVHRDIKPSNLLFAKGHGPDAIKLTDLGLARLRMEDANEQTKPGAMLGTADYIAPEQASDASRVDIRADIYSLGCTLYFLLAGQPPFPGGTTMEKMFAHCQSEPEPIEQRRPDLPAALIPVLRRMMAKRPEDRYQTPQEVAHVLEPLCQLGQIQEAASRPLPVLGSSRRSEPGTTHTGFDSDDPPGRSRSIAPPVALAAGRGRREHPLSRSPVLAVDSFAWPQRWRGRGRHQTDRFQAGRSQTYLHQFPQHEAGSRAGRKIHDGIAGHGTAARRRRRPGT